MKPWLAKAWETVRQLFHADWLELKALFFKEGVFWLVEYVLVLAALYSAAHLFRRRSLLSKPICFLTGHRWEVLERDQVRWNSNQRALGDTLAGSRCVCRRCAREWSDLPTAAELAERNRPAPVQPVAPPDPMTEMLHEMRRTATPGMWSQTTVTRTVTTTQPKRRGRKKDSGPTRFERDVLEDEEVTDDASPQEDEEPEKPAGTNTPTPQSEPADSEP